MDIKKFKNGKVKLTVTKSDFINGEINENVYHDDMFMSDLYISQINGYQYITDFNTSLCYDMGSYLIQNPLKYLLDELTEKKTIYLYPLSRKQSQELLEDMENGF